MELQDARTRTAEMLPGLIEQLRELVGHASVAFAGYPSDPVVRMGTATADLLARAGFTGVRMLEGSATYPTIYADMPGPPGSPTALLYAHYDVQPAPVEAGWDSDPCVLTERDGRYYGRGAADDKAGVIIHAATMRLFDGRPPVGIRLVVEGTEEASSALGPFVAANPDLFRADVFVIADMGNLVAGKPVLTATLRGDVMCYVETRTIDHAVHSGVFGGAAPDALVALTSILAHCGTQTGARSCPDSTATTGPPRSSRRTSFDRPQESCRGLDSLEQVRLRAVCGASRAQRSSGSTFPAWRRPRTSSSHEPEPRSA